MNVVTLWHMLFLFSVCCRVCVCVYIYMCVYTGTFDNHLRVSAARHASSAAGLEQAGLPLHGHHYHGPS